MFFLIFSLRKVDLFNNNSIDCLNTHWIYKKYGFSNNTKTTQSKDGVVDQILCVKKDRLRNHHTAEGTETL